MERQSIIWKRDFEIGFTGLKNGIHQFNYHLDKNFFSHFESSPISESAMEADLRFEKHNDFFLLDFAFSGTVNVSCDRCSEYFDMPLYADESLIVKLVEFVPDNAGDEDEVIYLAKTETHLNLSQVLYELLVVNLPMHILHPEKNGKSTCDPKILKLLKNSEPGHELHQPDPRWNTLKKIKIK